MKMVNTFNLGNIATLSTGQTEAVAAVPGVGGVAGPIVRNVPRSLDGINGALTFAQLNDALESYQMDAFLVIGNSECASLPAGGYAGLMRLTQIDGIHYRLMYVEYQANTIAVYLLILFSDDILRNVHS